MSAFTMAALSLPFASLPTGGGESSRQCNITTTAVGLGAFCYCASIAIYSLIKQDDNQTAIVLSVERLCLLMELAPIDVEI